MDKNYENMTIPELKKYVNAMSNEEFSAFLEVYDSDDIDPTELLDAPRLYDFLQYMQGGKAEIEFM